MQNLCRLDVIILDKYQPSVKMRSNAYIFPGEHFPSAGLSPTMCLGAAYQFGYTQEETPRLVCDMHVRTYMPGHSRAGFPLFLRENAKDIVVLVSRNGYFLMERASALEIQGSWH